MYKYIIVVDYTYREGLHTCRVVFLGLTNISINWQLKFRYSQRQDSCKNKSLSFWNGFPYIVVLVSINFTENMANTSDIMTLATAFSLKYVLRFCSKKWSNLRNYGVTFVYGHWLCAYCTEISHKIFIT